MEKLSSSKSKGSKDRMYKTIAVDMDGTLLRDDKTISNLVKEKIKKAGEAGVKVVLTTGRPIQGIQKYLEELELTKEGNYVVAVNGALVSRANDFSVISSGAVLTGKDVKYIYGKVKHLNTYFHSYGSKEDFVNVRSKFSDAEEIRVGLKVKVIDFLTDIRDDDILLKAILEEEPEILDEITSKIPGELFEQYNVIRSAPFMIEIIDKNCNKAVGLEKLAHHLGIKKEEIMAIGDAENDIEMLTYAGLGVVMGNAGDEIKKLAGFIAKSNEEDGVAEVIDKFVLNI
jgi:Cof subfamily protein (haloacid dehalogenase superfamily)